MDPQQVWQTVIDVGLRIGLQVVGAIIVFVVGRRLIELAVRITSGALSKQHVDPTLLRYVGNFISAALTAMPIATPAAATSAAKVVVSTPK